MTGRLVRSGDVRALGDALLSLLSDPVACAGLGRRGRERAQDVFGPPSVADRLARLYRETAEAGAAGRKARDRAAEGWARP